MGYLRALGVAAVATLLGACTAVGPDRPAPPATSADSQTINPLQADNSVTDQAQPLQADNSVTDQAQPLQADNGATDQAQPLLPFLAGIQLSAAQTGQIEAILAKHRPTVTPEQAQQAAEKSAQQLKALLLAPTIDQAKLRDHFLAQAQLAKAAQQRSVTMLAEVRLVLSAAQRQAAATAILDEIKQAQRMAGQGAASPPPANAGAAGPDLKLTPAQQALFSAAQPPVVPALARAAQTALPDFLVSGNTQALLGPPIPTDRASALAKAYASLTLAQRTTLVNFQPPVTSAGGAPTGEGATP